MVTIMDNIKVGLLTSEFLPNWGGVGTYCIEMARALSNLVDLHVITVGRVNKGQLVYSEKTIRSLFGEKIGVNFLATSSMEDTFLYNAKMQLSVAKRLPKLMRELHLDVLHTNFPHMSDILLRVARNVALPSITTLHTTISGQRQGTVSSRTSFMEHEYSEKWTVLLYPLIRIAEELYLRNSENFATVSNWMRLQIQQRFPFVRNLHVVYNGVDASRFSPEARRGAPFQFSDPVILFSSRLTAAKGVKILMKAMPMILRQNRDVHFVFSGAGQSKPWARLLGKLGVDERRYTFLGWLDYELLPALYAEADIFVAPSLYENLPIRILEAMASECAVVASDVGAVSEAVENGRNGLLVEPGNDKEFSESVLVLLEDEDLRKKLGKNARKSVSEKFSWSKSAQKMAGIYQSIIA